MKTASRCPYGPTAVVTGASSGIGLAVTAALCRRGFTVYALSRRAVEPERPPEGGRILPLQCDVTDEEAVRSALERIAQEAGGFALLINCAGNGVAGAVEETSDAETRAQLEVNYFGTARVCRLALPWLRAAGRSLILNTGSVAGFIPIPFQAHYSASKAATEALSLALDAETRPLGVRCVLVQPGDTRTGFTGARVVAGAAAGDKSPYGGRFERSLRRMERDEQQGDDPDRVAAAYLRMVFRKRPPARVTPGHPMYRIAALLRRLLPERWFRYIINILYAV